MIVMKFGGTSLESAEALSRVAGIVAARRAESPFVVVSAMGKTTNELLAIGHAAASGRMEEFRAGLARLREYHLREAAAALGAAQAEQKKGAGGDLHWQDYECRARARRGVRPDRESFGGSRRPGLPMSGPRLRKGRRVRTLEGRWAIRSRA